METVAFTLLVAVTVLLTVALLGALRGVAAIRLEIQGAGQPAGGRTFANDYVAAGRSLLPQLASQLPWLDEDGLIVFLSATCPLCWQTAQQFDEWRIANVAVGVVGTGGEELTEAVPARFTLIPRAVAEELATLYQFEALPFGLHQRDGVVVGTIHSDALVSLEEIERFWKYSGAPLLEVSA
jgi:hypothetical protein